MTYPFEIKTFFKRRIDSNLIYSGTSKVATLYGEENCYESEVISSVEMLINQRGEIILKDSDGESVKILPSQIEHLEKLIEIVKKELNNG